MGVDTWQRLIDAALAGEAAPAGAPPPWEAWLVVALLVQRERQRWHRGIVDRVLVHVADDCGDLPGWPGWTYEQHGIGYCLVGPDGELLDVDLRDADGAVIDPWFFAGRVESVATTRLAERRLWRWRPKTDLVVDGLDALAMAGVIVHGEEPRQHFVTLAPVLGARAAEVAADLARPDAEARWRAALGDRDDDAQRAAHRQWLVELTRTSARRGQVLEVVLGVVDPAMGFALLREQLLGPIEYAAGRAVELLRRRDLPDCPDVVAFLRRIDPATAPPYPGYQAVAYLLERGLEPAYARARFDELAAVRVSPGFLGNPFASDFAILALRLLPERALALVRAALRSTTPMCVEAIASLLAVLDQRWCQRELTAALPEASAGSRPTIVAALRHSGSELARRRAEAHDLPPPHDPEAIGFTWEEVAYANADMFMDGAIGKARAVADELRGRYPEDWGAELRSP